MPQIIFYFWKVSKLDELKSLLCIMLRVSTLRRYKFQKRKRNAYLSQNISPPNTRQSVRNRNKLERAGSPKNSSRPCSPTEQVKKLIQPFPSIPNLPSGLTIERIQPAHADLLDTKHCVECRLSG